MKAQPWDLNQTWPVGRKWCRFTNAPKTCPPNLGRKNIKFLNTFFATSAFDTAYLRNKKSRRQTKVLVSIYKVSPKRWPTFRDLWPRNGWDPFVHCDPTFGGHYVATIIVATSTCLVTTELVLWGTGYEMSRMTNRVCHKPCIRCTIYTTALI